MKYTFHFKKKSEHEGTLYMMIRNNQERVSISTKIVEDPATWNPEKEEFDNTCEYYRTNNEILLRYKSAAAKAIREFQLLDPKKRNIESIRDSIISDLGCGAENSKSKNSFLNFYKKWCVTSTTKRVANRQMLYSLHLFMKYVGSRDITFDDVNYMFIEDYIEWMSDRGLCANTRGNQIKRIKTAMHESYEMGLHQNLDFRKFRKEQEEVDNIYLDREDLDKLEKVEVKGTQRLVRDVFLIGCYTAMRYQDYSRLSEDDIIDGCIHQIQKKTNERVVIPVAPKVQEILDYYGGELPTISPERFNEYIKDVCRLAGIDRMITIIKNGKQIRVEKWKLVSSHTARRTAATNMFKAGIPAISIMKITGHRTEANFMKYIKITKEENAQMLKNNQFFK